MLVELRIRDFAVVRDLSLTLGPGLSVLTGETGAGKSIIVGALSLLLGERASSGMVRKGAAKSTIEAVFDLRGLPAVTAYLDTLGFTVDDDTLVLKREVAAEGRSRAWVNASPATAGIVGEIGAALVDLHGQHEHQTLLRAREQRSILDAYAGGSELAAEVAGRHAALEGVRREMSERRRRTREVEGRLDFLRFQLAEIEGARLAAGEDDALSAESSRLEHAADLAGGVAEVYQALYAGEGSASDRIAAARRTLERLVRFDAGLRGELTALEEAYHLVSELGRSLGGYPSTLDHDPRRLEEVRERLDRIQRLKRKYGPELQDVLGTAQSIRAELQAIDESEHDLAEIARRIASEDALLREAAGRLTTLRRAAAERLSLEVTRELPGLGLEGAAFEVRLLPQEQVSSGGAESVEFLVAPNRGFDPMPLARIASGGELSRVMLALKAILAEVDQVPVLVFDEIDAGIGGAVGSAVAAKLEGVARTHQVFVVTHLAQVASRGGTHLLVEKGVEVPGDTTTTTVRALEGEARVAEIARMLGGDPESVVSREHARELLSR